MEKHKVLFCDSFYADKDMHSFLKNFSNTYFVLIRCHNERGDEIYGSGTFFSSDGFILTCKHVINNAIEIDVRLLCPETGELQFYKAKVIFSTPEEGDAAILVCDDFSPAGQLEDENNRLYIERQMDHIAKGSSVLVVGYPYIDSLFELYGNGINKEEFLLSVESVVLHANISSFIVKDGHKKILLDMKGSAVGGMSGGAVIEEKTGKWIGMFQGGLSNTGLVSVVMENTPNLLHLESPEYEKLKVEILDKDMFKIAVPLENIFGDNWN